MESYCSWTETINNLPVFTQQPLLPPPLDIFGSFCDQEAGRRMSDTGRMSIKSRGSPPTPPYSNMLGSKLHEHVERSELVCVFFYACITVFVWIVTYIVYVLFSVCFCFWLCSAPGITRSSICVKKQNYTDIAEEQQILWISGGDSGAYWCLVRNVTDGIIRLQGSLQ